MVQQRTIVDVLPEKGRERGWQVRVRGGETHHHKRKSEALRDARALARSRMPSQIVIRKANGHVQEEWTYGNDPARYPS